MINRNTVSVTWVRTEGEFAVIEGPEKSVWRVPLSALPKGQPPLELRVSFRTGAEQQADYAQLTRHLLEEMLNGDEQTAKKIS